jgi:hypothetical protein
MNGLQVRGVQTTRGLHLAHSDCDMGTPQSNASPSSSTWLSGSTSPALATGLQLAYELRYWMGIGHSASPLNGHLLPATPTHSRAPVP